MGRRKFAKNSENVRHFRLVARSQNDVHADTPGATPLVLEPFAPPGATRRTGLSEAELCEVPQSLVEDIGAELFGQERDPTSAPCRSTEGHEGLSDDLDGDCYFPKDGYNYEQHLKRVGGAQGSGVAGVVMEAPTKVPRTSLNLQPATNDDEAEVLRALEHAEEYEELEDEEFEEMVPAGVAVPEDMLLWGPTALENQDLPDLDLFRQMRENARELAAEKGLDDGVSGTGVETRSNAVSEQKFDQFLADEYGEDELGACEDEEIEGPMLLENCEEILDEYIEDKKAKAAMLSSLYEPIKGKLDDVPRAIDETRAIIEKQHYDEEGGEDDTSSGEESPDESRTWDCETILSTLSNLSNRPGKIERIKVVKKPALKAVAEGTVAEDKSESSEEDVVELPDVVTVRPRGETSEEKRERKAAVKEMRRVCRKMKKDSKDMFKSESLKLPAHGGADVRAKTRCFKL